MPQERRRTPRYPFIATAEVVEQTNKTSLTTRVTELSLYGCYVEMAQPLAEGTMIHIKIYSEGRFFESDGKVVYAMANAGIGVCFRDVRAQYLTTLKEWLVMAAQAKFGKRS